MKIQGIIEDKEVTQKDDWTRAVFVIGGKKYSTFDSEIIKNFSKGQSVEMETKQVEKDGKTYNNMTSMKILEGDAAITQKVAHNGSNGNGCRTPEQMIMCEMTSYAKDIFCAMYEKDFNKEDLMNMAINLIKQAKKAFE